MGTVVRDITVICGEGHITVICRSAYYNEEMERHYPTNGVSQYLSLIHI